MAREPVTSKAGLEPSSLSFGRGYLISKPFDPRLLAREAAARTGVARLALDAREYEARLRRLARTR
jgi:hypothetical protein